MKLASWVEITRPPSSGKTSLINALSDKALSVYTEVAREIIQADEQSHYYARDRLVLQRDILTITLRREHLLLVDKRFFFDGAIPESIAYFINLLPRWLFALLNSDNMQRFFIARSCLL